MCRWLERDPAGYQDGPSLYSYLGRNPMAGTDPYGLSFGGSGGAEEPGRRRVRTLLPKPGSGLRRSMVGADHPAAIRQRAEDDWRRRCGPQFGSDAEFAADMRFDSDRRERLREVAGGIRTGIETTASVLPGGGFATAVNEASKGNFGAAALSAIPGVAALKVLRVGAGAKLATGASDELYVIGRSWDTKVAKDWNGHVVLDVETWSEGLNRAWVDEAVAARRTFYVASPTQGNLVQASGKFAGDETVFAKELRWLQEAGYIRVGDYLVHPSRVAEFLQP